MAINILKTRIQSKYDTLSNWIASASALNGHTPFIPLRGEICIVEIPSTATPSDTTESGQGQLSPPAIAIKVGDGIHNFTELPWIQSLAGDVYSWAKASTKPTYTGSEITAIRKNSADLTDESKWTQPSVEAWLQSLTNEIDSLSGGAGSISTQIANALADLDVDNDEDSSLANHITGFAPDKTLATLTETNGFIDATFQDIAITKDQVSGLGTAASANVATTGISDTSNTNDLTTKAQVKSYVESQVAGLSGAMHYRGSVTADPTTTTPTGTYNAGDVVTYDNSEYVYDGTSWRELGDEGSYALKTTTVTGTDGLTGGGAISSNQTISHAVPSGATASTKGTAGGRTYIQTITTDKFGHITDVATATETVTDTTYTFAEGSVNGEFSVTPTGGTASQVKVHGLDAAAYKDVSTSIPASGTADDAKLPTVAAVKAYASGLVTDLDSSQSATVANGDVYSVLTGITQTNGELSSHTEVTLAKIAKTGSIYDITEGSNTTATGSQKYLILDCGSASILVD